MILGLILKVKDNSMANKTLYFNLQKRWFDLIDSGDKKEEYREIKEHWVLRLIENKGYWCSHILSEKLRGIFWYYRGRNNSRVNAVKEILKHEEINFKEFDTVTFVNGYSGKARKLIVEFKGIEIGFPISGLSEEGWLDRNVFKIKLGEIIKRENYGHTN